MVVALMEQYTPQRYIHREEQIKEIKNVFINYKKFGYGGNHLIIGASGSGKTSITLSVIKEENNSSYINVRESDSSNKIFSKLTGIIKKTDTTTLIQIFINNLKQTPKILVIDEIDKCKDIKVFVDGLNTVYRSIQIPIIVITNNWNLLNLIADDAWKTLAFSRIEFPAYDTKELKDILNDRLEAMKAYMNIDIPSESKDYLCCRVKKLFNSSARIVLDIFSNCIIENDYSFEFIEKAIYKKDKETWFYLINNLSEMEKEFLQIALELSEKENEILTSEVRNNLSTTLSEARISQIVRSLTAHGFILMSSKKTGNVGNSRRIISFPDEETKSNLLSILSPYK